MELEERIAKLEKIQISNINEASIQTYIEKRLESIIKRTEEFETRIEVKLARQNDEITNKIFNANKLNSIPSADIQKIETAINEWTKGIEEQLNVFVSCKNRVLRIFQIKRLI